MASAKRKTPAAPKSAAPAPKPAYEAEATYDVVFVTKAPIGRAWFVPGRKYKVVGATLNLVREHVLDAKKS